jgi:hypothetical protein
MALIPLNAICAERGAQPVLALRRAAEARARSRHCLDLIDAENAVDELQAAAKFARCHLTRIARGV